jgi:hypothetical protein
MGILYTEGSTEAQASEAERVMALLCATYPGHPWAVRVDEGIIFIRHLQFAGNWGMNIRTADVDHDAAVMKKKIVMLAGEFLERAGLVRGRENGDEIKRVDGVPDRYQPPAEKPAIQFETVINVADHTPMREQPRQQVLRGNGSGN